MNPQTCGECDGAGRDFNFVVCDACDGTGITKPDEDFASMRSPEFDAKLEDYLAENLSIELHVETDWYDDETKTVTVHLKLGEREISKAHVYI